jgi:pyruvate dehydrogenase E2 component (dihydrolipoamide acetyltransferase)
VQQEIVMPQLGLTMTEGAVSTWMKKPGDRIERGEILFLVQTDKVEMEVESFISGVLENVLVEPEVVVKVGTVIATVEDGRPAVPKVIPEKTEASVAAPNGSLEPSPVAMTRVEKGRVPVSPRARKMAQALGIDLASVTPANGVRIVEEDVRQFQEKTVLKEPQPPRSSIPRSERAVVAQRMVESFHSAPHFYLTAQADATKLVDLRMASVEILRARTGVKPTYTDFFLRALAQALSENPAVNSFWSANAVEPRSTIDLSIAVQTQNGLLTPVLRQADGLTFAELIKQRSVLVEKAATRKLSLQDLEGGSATLSNLGSHKIDEFHAILNPPQSIILATGQIAKRPWVIDDRVEARSTVFLTLSADHRVLDGVVAAAFLDRIRELLENPHALLV